MSRTQPRATIGNRMQESPTGLTDTEFVQVEKLSRAAANASLKARRGHLADDQFDSLAVHLLGIGIAAWIAWDPELSGGVSRETYAFRRMRGRRPGGTFTEGPYIDWMRARIRDSRFEPEGSTSVTFSGELPDVQCSDSDPLELEVAVMGARLSESARWALETLAAPMAEGDLTLDEAAQLANVDPRFARVLMGTLRDELRDHEPDQETPDSETVEIPAWAMVA